MFSVLTIQLTTFFCGTNDLMPSNNSLASSFRCLSFGAFFGHLSVM